MNNVSVVEMHVIKNYPFGNPNRDITGSPKWGTFNGEARARISSPCLKRIIRKSHYFDDLNTRGIILDIVGTRTREIAYLVEKELESRGNYKEYLDDIKALLKKVGKGEDSKSEKDVVQLYSKQDVSKIADIIVDKINSSGNLKGLSIEKELRNYAIRPVTLDILLFGRMATTASFTTVEAACAIAQGMGTHKLKTHTDFFTAVDDVIEELGESGSGHLDDREFTSNCIYQYYVIDIDLFIENLKKYNIENEDVDYDTLKEIVSDVVVRFINAVANTCPTGMYHSMPSNPPISAMIVQLREKHNGFSYNSAFLESAEGNILKTSISNLFNYTNNRDICDGTPYKRYWVNPDGDKEITLNFGINSESIDNLTASVKEDIIGK